MRIKRFNEGWFSREDDDSVKDIINRLKKVNPKNNPYDIRKLGGFENNSGDLYEVEFDDITIKISFKEMRNPGGQYFKRYFLSFFPTLEYSEYQEMSVSMSLSHKLFELVDSIYKNN